MVFSLSAMSSGMHMDKVVMILIILIFVKVIGLAGKAIPGSCFWRNPKFSNNFGVRGSTSGTRFNPILPSTAAN
jgi:hypothetical protein